MTLAVLRIASRKSPLALWQARYVASVLCRHYPEWSVEVIPLLTSGDTLLDQPLSQSGGKGLFIKELEQALLDRRADIAVHSMKDVPVTLPMDLIITATMQREDPADAFVSNRFVGLEQLPAGTTVGTSSLRRHCQLAHRYPNLMIQPLRGNINTRLKRLDEGKFDAVILACAGLKRLGYVHRISERITFETCLPAIGQGALGIECCAENVSLRKRLEVLHDQTTGNCVAAERAVSQALNGDCRLPIAAYAEQRETRLHLQACVGNLNGTILLTAQAMGNDPHITGTEVAQNLIAQGADRILAACRHQT